MTAAANHGAFPLDAEAFFLTRQGQVMPIPSWFDHSEPGAPLCSIVIPCYNYGSYLPESVASALDQTLPSVEVIIVDDGSTDPSTREVIGKFVGKPRVTVVFQRNAGLSTTRNTGIRTARGKFICCLDADDVLQPAYVEQCLLEFDRYPSAGFVYSLVRLFGEENTTWATRHFDIDEALIDNHTAVSAVFRKADWVLAGGYDQRMQGGYEDWEFWLRLAQLGRCGRRIEQELFWHRCHGATMTHSAHNMRQILIGRMHTLNPKLFEDQGYRVRLKEAGAPVQRLEPILPNLSLVPPAGQTEKPGLLVVLPWLKPGGAETLMADVLAGLAQTFALTIVTTCPDQHLLTPLFKTFTKDILAFPQGETDPFFALFLIHLVRTRGIGGVLSSGSRACYDSLPALRAACPDLLVADLLHNAWPEGHLASALSQTAYIDIHIGVADCIRDALLAAGVPDARIRIVKNGVDCTSLFRPRPERRDSLRASLGLPAGRPVLAFVGRASPEKRPLLFLELLDRLRKDANAFGLFVSHGPLLEECKSMIASRDLVNDLVMLDELVPRDEIWRIYTAADVLINVSSIEGNPMTILEGLACGCPIAGMEVGGVAEIVRNGVNGILTGRDDLEGLRERLADLLLDAPRLEHYRAAARQSVLDADANLATTVASYRKIFDVLLRSRQAPAAPEGTAHG